MEAKDLPQDMHRRAAVAAHANFQEALEAVRRAKTTRGVAFMTANEDGGLSLRAIAKEVGLSHSAVQQAIDEAKATK